MVTFKNGTQVQVNEFKPATATKPAQSPGEKNKKKNQVYILILLVCLLVTACALYSYFTS